MSAALQSTEELPLFLCIGDLDVDVLIEVDRLPTRDGKVNGVLKQKAPGGMAGNVAAALARLGSRVRVLGRIGDDADGAFAVKSLEQVGVDTSFVSRLAGVATFSCISLLTPDGEKSLVKLMTSAYRPDASDVKEATLEGVRHLHLTSIGDPALCRRVVDAARTCRGDGVARHRARRLPGRRGPFCSMRSRASISSSATRNPAPSWMPRSGGHSRVLAAAVVTTLGADGAQVETAEGHIASPGFTPKIVDTTGAGDCFAAACLHARLAAKLSWKDALRFANCAAAISTTGLGAQSALPTADQVVAYLRAEPTGS